MYAEFKEELRSPQRQPRDNGPSLTDAGRIHAAAAEAGLGARKPVPDQGSVELAASPSSLNLLTERALNGG